MAVFLRKLINCIVKEPVPAACQKACPMKVDGTRKTTNATAASRG